MGQKVASCGQGRRRPSICRCLLWTSAIVTVIVLGGVMNFLLHIFQNARAPHLALYANKTLGEIEDLSEVVRPLIDENQRFDIVATVWIKNWTGQHHSPGFWWLMDSKPVIETPIFSGSIFKGVTLKDQHVYSNIALEIPLHGFDTAELTNNDLRASFVLVPTSPSPLDNFDSYSSWRPFRFIFPPSRPELPATSGVDDALNSFAISVPLLDLRSISSVCSPEDQGTDFSEADGDDDEPLGFQTTHGKSPLLHHPYVVTRTQLRVVRMTKLYDLQAYDKFQRELTRSNGGCNSRSTSVSDWRGCTRSFVERANAETKIQLGVPEEGRKNRTEWAYAPFMHVTPNSWGPLDLVPIPVNREKCSIEAVNQPKSQDFLNVTWHVVYSGSTPDRIRLGDLLSTVTDTFDMTDPEPRKAEVQQNIQITQRIHGHKFGKDAHIVRLLILAFFSTTFSIIRPFLDFHYWRTRVNTVGISIPGTVVVATSLFLSFPLSIWLQTIGDGLDSWIWSAADVVLFWPIPLAMFKAIFHVKVIFWRGIVPVCLQTTPASHTERASGRLEVLGRRWLLSIVLLATFFVQIILHLRYDALGYQDTPDVPEGVFALARRIEPFLLGPMLVAGKVFQILMNHRSNTFAGQYKSSLWLEWAERAIELAGFFPALTGDVVVKPVYRAVESLPTLLLLICSYQALRYPEVAQVAVDKDVE